MRSYSKPNDIVLSLGDGPGTGAIAALRERRCVDLDLELCRYRGLLRI